MSLLIIFYALLFASPVIGPFLGFLLLSSAPTGLAKRQERTPEEFIQFGRRVIFGVGALAFAFILFSVWIGIHQ